MDRRHFVRTAALGAATPFVAPRAAFLRRRGEQVAVGVIGAGGMGASNAAALAGLPSARIVAWADVDAARAMAATAERPVLADAYTRATRYADYREMLARERGLDAVVIATPDHVHAHAALLAMERGLHVYVQKPLTFTIDESRRLARAAAARRLVTQMGNQGHSGDDGRHAVEVVRAGVLGRVTEVEAWTNRPNGWWPQGVPASEPAPVPAGLDWDVYLGPNALQPYRPGIHPFGWRGWVGFGVGSLGDMGAHLVDFPIWALDLARPSRVETRHTPWGGGAEAPATYQLATVSSYRFDAAGPAAGAAGGAGPVRLTWYDGGLLPPTPESAPVGFTVDPNGGVLYRGERGILVHETYGERPRFLPVAGGPSAEALAAEAAAVPASLPRIAGGIRGHEADWIAAILEGREASCPFRYAAHLNEIMLLGVAAMRAGAPLAVAPDGRLSGVDDAEALLTRSYRAGWALPDVG